MSQRRREAERRRIAQQHAAEKIQTQAAKAAEKARKEYERARAADQKEQARLYAESRQAQVALQNEQLDEQIQSFERLLVSALSTDPYIDIQTLKEAPNFPLFNPGALAAAELPPQLHMYMPS